MKGQRVGIFVFKASDPASPIQCSNESKIPVILGPHTLHIAIPRLTTSQQILEPSPGM